MFFNPKHLENYYNNLRTINNLSFSKREIDIIACIINGRTAYKEIAHILSISPRTVEVNKSNINKKIHAFKNCNIINFLEKSDKYSLTKNHYINLLNQNNFKKTLNNISLLLKKQKPICIKIYYLDNDNKICIKSELEKHLKLLEIKIKTQNIKNISSNDSLDDNTFFLLLILPQNCLDNIKIAHNAHSNHLELAENLKIISNTKVIFLYCDKIPEHILEWLNHNKCQPVIITKSYFQENYYQAFFELLTQLDIVSDTEIQKLITSFIDEYNNSKSAKQSNLIEENFTPGILANTYNTKKPLTTVCIILIMVIIFGIFYFNKQDTFLVRSDLVIPVKSVLLDREYILDDIYKKFDNNKKNEIQTIALIGPGGVGKTILARQYAIKQNSSIIWEINAESKITLIKSFEYLAMRLSINDEDKKILEFLQSMQDSSQKEEEIINFVKQRLLAHPNWLLIYDNVEDIANIQKYIHPASKAWGIGKIIITSRDSNIQFNKYINHTIHVNELNQLERQKLFTKIIGNENNKYFKNNQHLDELLENIPPFPLDISIAAYYLKMTDTSLENYFEHLKQYDKVFANLQSSIMKETEDYSHTRYSIIASSLDNILKVDQNFNELLLFIGLIDSQDIPRSLLNKHKNNLVTENFIYTLKKYSLITNESSSITDSTFSLHRATQAVILNYIISKLDLKNNSQFLTKITHTFENYLQELMDNESVVKIRAIQQHSNAFLSHKDIIDNQSMGIISAQLGLISYYTNCNNLITKQLLEDSLNSLNSLKSISRTNELRIARVSTYLGNTYRRLADYQKAELLLTHSLERFRQYKGNEANIARALLYLGMVYRDTGDFSKAKIVSKDSIKQYEYIKSTDLLDLKKASMTQELAVILRETKEYNKSQKLLEDILNVYSKHYDYDHPNISWTTVQLGILYRKIGNYNKAKNLLEQGLTNYEKYFPKDHLHVSWTKVQIAALHRELKEYQKAKDLLEISIINLEKYYSKTHPRVSWAMTHLGIVYAAMGNYKKAKILFEESLANYRKYYSDNHPSIIWVVKHLNNIKDFVE